MKEIMLSLNHQQPTAKTTLRKQEIKFVDEEQSLIYYPVNTGKEVIQKYMSSNHSEVAAA